MEDIVETVNRAELEAEEIKEAADVKCAAILADAEKRAEEILKATRAELKSYREERLAAAAKAAQSEYESEVEKSRKSAKEYAQSVAKHTAREVAEAVGRIAGGNS